MLRWVAVVGVVGGVGTALAEPVRMSADDIKRTMQPGAILAIDTPLRTVIPVKVDSQSMVSAEAGALGLTLGALKDRGRWWVENDQLCMKWFRWFDAKARCITLQREGDRVQWYENSGESGTATITEAPRAAVAVAAPRQPEKPVLVETANVEASPPPARPKPIEESQRSALGAMTGTMPQPAYDAGTSRPPASVPRAPASAAKAPDVPPAPRARPAKSATSVARADSATPPRKTQRPQVAEAKGTSTSSALALASFRVSRVDDGDTLNVRSGPSEYHEAVGAIPAGGRGVQIVGACKDLWCPIRHGRLKGWVNRYYLAEDFGQRTADKR